MPIEIQILRKAQNVAGLNQLMVHNPADVDIKPVNGSQPCRC